MVGTNIPLVSIILTTYNREDGARRAMQSVFMQSYSNYELIVVEDASKSSLGEYIISLNKPNIKYFCQSSNKGLPAARNAGIQIGKGEYFTFLDDDDLLMPDYLERKVSLINSTKEEERANIGLVMSGREKRDKQENILSKHAPNLNGSMFELTKSGLIETVSSSLFISKLAFSTCAFDEKLMSSVDHDIWMQLAAAKYNVHTIKECLVINYEKIGRNTMMKDPLKRVNGIKQFLVKWRPFFYQNLGAKKGEEFAKLYFAKAATSFAIFQLESKNYSVFFKAIKEIQMFSGYKPKYVKIYVGSTFKRLIKSALGVKRA